MPVRRLRRAGTFPFGVGAASERESPHPVPETGFSASKTGTTALETAHCFRTGLFYWAAAKMYESTTAPKSKALSGCSGQVFSIVNLIGVPDGI